jgi:hypothetical protein
MNEEWNGELIATHVRLLRVDGALSPSQSLSEEGWIFHSGDLSARFVQDLDAAMERIDNSSAILNGIVTGTLLEKSPAQVGTIIRERISQRQDLRKKRLENAVPLLITAQSTVEADDMVFMTLPTGKTGFPEPNQEALSHLADQSQMCAELVVAVLSLWSSGDFIISEVENGFSFEKPGGEEFNYLSIDLSNMHLRNTRNTRAVTDQGLSEIRSITQMLLGRVDLKIVVDLLGASTLQSGDVLSAFVLGWAALEQLITIGFGSNTPLYKHQLDSVENPKSLTSQFKGISRALSGGSKSQDLAIFENLYKKRNDMYHNGKLAVSSEDVNDVNELVRRYLQILVPLQ